MTLPVVAIDTETALIRQGLLAPPLACVSSCIVLGEEPSLNHHSTALTFLQGCFSPAARGRLIIVGHNFAFDSAVLMARFPVLMPIIFGAYDQGMIRDTMLQERLLDLAEGKLMRSGYSLDAIYQRYGGEPLDKGADGWRLRYGELINVGLPHWPERAVKYAKDDARVTMEVYYKQLERAEGLALTLPDVLFDSGAQARQAFGLYLQSCRGVKTDEEAIDKLAAKFTIQRDENFAVLKDAGWTGKGGSITQAPIKAVVEAFAASKITDELRHEAEMDPELDWDCTRSDLDLAKELGYLVVTDKGATSIAAMVLKQIPDDPRLQAKVAHAKAVKGLGTYIHKLKMGVEYPIQPGFNSLLETGRVSMQGWGGIPKEVKVFSLQTLPREGGMRECFRPRPGFVYADVDYAVAELRSLGQVMLNLFGLEGSPFAQGFRADPNMDPHTELAATMMGISVGQAYALRAAGKLPRRQDAKAGNFGRPGGMGKKRFEATEAKKYWETDGKQGGLYTRDQTTAIFNAMDERWALDRYFKYIGEATSWGSATIKQFVSGRYRGGVGYCDGANGYFQALTADYSKEGSYRAVREGFLNEASPLYGSRLVLFVHDQNIAEVPVEGAHEAATRLSEIMVEAAEEYTPDVPAVAEPALCDRMSKSVETIRDKHGRLQVWTPAHDPSVRAGH